jgi:hypothetical protein
MHTYVKLLEKVSHQYSSSRQLSFGIGHIFKALQLAKQNGHISRGLLGNELSLGGGSIKTLVKHLKTTNMIKTSNAGTILSEKGERIISQILLHIPKETVIPESSITSGIEQRDIAIKSGATGATTLIFKDEKFLVPKINFNALAGEVNMQKILIENLQPENDDVIIIGSDNTTKQNAELAAKNAALFTIMNHLKH